MEQVPPLSPLPQAAMGTYRDEEKGTPVFEMDNGNERMGGNLGINGERRYEDRSPNGTVRSFGLFPRQQMRRESLGKEAEPRDF